MKMNRTFIAGVSLLLAIVFLIPEDASAQRRKRKKDDDLKLTIYDIDTLISPIPRNRQLWHGKIDNEQKRADVSDGTIDGTIYFAEDTLYTNALTRSILQEVDHMQIMIENLPARNRDAVTDNQEKIRYLTAVQDMMYRYNLDVKVEPFYYKRLVNNMREMIIANEEGEMSQFVRANTNIYTLNNVKKILSETSPERAYIYREMGKKEPAMMIKRLSEFASHPYADDVIAAAAKVVPVDVFNYASSTNYALSGAVRRSNDPLVQTIVRIASESNSPLKAMPFLSDIHNKRKTIAEIDKIAANPDDFYQNLVRLKLQNETLGGSTYTDELKYRGLKYVREMNDLHESQDPVRFKCIDNFSPETLYFIMVYGQDEIYTSSFLGTFNRMLQRMDSTKGNELLEKVHRDRFRTFIRMCAGYNTLGRFLATMEPDKKTALMKDFIAGLDKGKEDDLEDAVDVADAFGSVTDKELADFLEQEVRNNYERSYKERSKKGVIVYGLLATLFTGARASETDEEIAKQSQKLSLPPINIIPYSKLVNDSGIVYQQFFFYGDDDGKSSYNSFLGNFKDKKWSIVNSKYWTTISSKEGKPVVIYANLPVPEPEDEEAQRQLCQYLADNNIHPTIVVHRGHSYHLPLTLDRLSKENRIVMLGSCGGYHNLATVLDHAPDAHIISSKQVGAMSVNEPIIKMMNDHLLAGSDINWIKSWKGLNEYFAVKGRTREKDLFVDYVPPHKNLGAIFIKAYRRMFNVSEEENS